MLIYMLTFEVFFCLNLTAITITIINTVKANIIPTTTLALIVTVFTCDPTLDVVTLMIQH